MRSSRQRTNVQGNFRLLMVFVCVLVIAGCTPTVLLSTVRFGSGGPTHIVIRESVIETLFAQTPAEELHIQNRYRYLSLYCQIAEGSMCYRVPYSAVETHARLDLSQNGEAIPIGREQTAKLFIKMMWVDPWKYIEQAQFNAVRIRCYHLESTPALIQCWVGFGRGWEPALVF